MSNTIIDLKGSKDLIGHLFEMEIGKITETIRRESKDDKDALILELQDKVRSLTKENKDILGVISELRRAISAR